MSSNNQYSDPSAGYEDSPNELAKLVAGCARANPKWAYLSGLFLPYTFTEFPGLNYPAVPGVTNTRPSGVPVSPYSGATGPVQISANALVTGDPVFIEYVKGVLKDWQGKDDKLYQEKKYESEHYGLSPGEFEATVAVGIAAVAGIGIALATRK